MRVLALDLSITATGAARPDGALEVLDPGNAKGDRRLAVITRAVGAIACMDLPHLAVIEDLPYGVRNAAAGPLGMVHGCVRLELMREHVPYVLVPPASLKTFATGRGNATKADMRMELYKRTGVDEGDDNLVDAWWLRAMAMSAYDQPLVELPQSHLRALEKVEWPA